FQADDGIRDFHVTGVQTCALPISAIECASSSVSASGFSQITCLPAASARSASGTWRLFGVQMCSRSMSGDSASSSAEPKGCSAPSSLAAAADRAGVDAATPTNRAPAWRIDRACTPPMKPVPAMPARRLLTTSRNLHKPLIACQAELGELSPLEALRSRGFYTMSGQDAGLSALLAV